MENEENWEEVKSSTGLWLPEKENESVQGVITEIKEGQYGLQVVIEDENGESITTPSHKVLQTRLNGFNVGDSVRIVFTGTDLPKVKGQNETRLYSVFQKATIQVEDI